MSLVNPFVFGGIPRPIREHKQVEQSRMHCVGLRCPTCATDLTRVSYHSLGQRHEAIECPHCSFALIQQHGIWLALAKDRLEHFQQFIHDYATVRKAEGRGSGNSYFYLELPYHDLTGQNSWQWGVRAKTYRYVERKLLPAIQGAAIEPFVVLDLGAGNGWLSYRLARMGHRPIAVDLQTNGFDGLGAAEHFRHVVPTLFPRFQAEMDRLPFESGQFDCVIFNASFHYSENYDHTLSEAIRCLRLGGTVVVADSPTYSREESGQRMLEERRKLFRARYGFTSDSLASEEYLTNERLLALEQKHHVKWTSHWVWYGLGWACRPLLASLKGRREPSQFRIYTAQVKTA
jgi:SAM-dependent methyltransferase